MYTESLENEDEVHEKVDEEIETLPKEDVVIMLGNLSVQIVKEE